MTKTTSDHSGQRYGHSGLLKQLEHGSEFQESLDKINYSVLLHCTRYPGLFTFSPTGPGTFLLYPTLPDTFPLGQKAFPFYSREFHTYSSGPESALDLRPFLSELQISPQPWGGVLSVPLAMMASHLGG